MPFVYGLFSSYLLPMSSLESSKHLIPLTLCLSDTWFSRCPWTMFLDSCIFILIVQHIFASKLLIVMIVRHTLGWLISCPKNTRYNQIRFWPKKGGAELKSKQDTIKTRLAYDISARHDREFHNLWSRDIYETKILMNNDILL